MKKSYIDHKRPQVKVEKLEKKVVDKGVVALIFMLLIINLVISLRILFG